MCRDGVVYLDVFFPAAVKEKSLLHISAQRTANVHSMTPTFHVMHNKMFKWHSSAIELWINCLIFSVGLHVVQDNTTFWTHNGETTRLKKYIAAKIVFMVVNKALAILSLLYLYLQTVTVFFFFWEMNPTQINICITPLFSHFIVYFCSLPALSQKGREHNAYFSLRSECDRNARRRR